MKLLEKMVNVGFLALLGLFLLAGLGRTLFWPKELNDYENRKANQMPKPEVETVLNAGFQAGAEDALSDQALLAQTFKRLYNEGSSRFLFGMVEGFLRENPERYIALRDAVVFGGDYLVYRPYDLAASTEKLDAKAEGLNALMDRCPELDFYVYYVEMDSDLNLETGEKAGLFEYLQAGLSLPPDRLGRFEISSFSRYRDCFYRTDHHWNHRGSYQGYVQLGALLGVEEPLMEPAEELTLPYRLSGSKAAASGIKGVFTEDFQAYRFAFPEMEIHINGQPAEDYGQQEAFFAGTADRASYAAFYGGDPGEIVFDTGREDRKNLLVIGESYDNAVLKLLACHFHKTYSVDLRNYEHDMGHTFAFSRYVQDNAVDMVLFVGSGSFFTMPEFLPEG